MEILCPILLVLVGLLVSKVEIFSSSEPQTMDMGGIGKQIIYYGKKDGISDLNKFYFTDMKNITSKELTFVNTGNDKDIIKNFVTKLFGQNFL